MVKHLESTKEKIQTILGKLLDEYHLGSEKDSVISLQMDQFLSDTNFDRVFFLKVLSNLKEMKVVTSFLLRKGSKVRHESDDIQDFDTCGIGITANFEKEIEEYLEHLSSNGSKNKSSSGMILYLEKNGDLWHGDNKKFCYPIEITSGRLILLKYLIENKGYQSTDTLSLILGGKDKKNIRTEIAKIKERVYNYLKIEDFIESKKDSGYRINPKYKVIITS